MNFTENKKICKEKISKSIEILSLQINGFISAMNQQIFHHSSYSDFIRQSVANFFADYVKIFSIICENLSEL
ncbi:hypothetical protein CHRY9390_00673 [Chryseobacterium aquaeductus]|uniref:Uncharacterized protein n=1 Tax=Chryseobacterium aquaeductus TaxID=2675056 RepID=A0A9N8MEA0_9FLAO|nr:hypothetical protein CHRY9390_00673 [Chryseobacterium potabilaquae]CAD7800739.1 hypothetical protein CHRY9390_00673 [Chryseobacterium aquaeductus]